MGWRDDAHGLRLRASEVKLFTPSHTWGMKLSQLAKQAGVVRILTYSLPGLPYLEMQFDRRPRDIQVLCHGKFLDRARQIKARYPEIAVAVHDRTHAKMLLIEPVTVYVGSANFGDSGWAEVCVGIRSAEAHAWYAAEFGRIWAQARVVI